MDSIDEFKNSHLQRIKEERDRLAKMLEDMRRECVIIPLDISPQSMADIITDKLGPKARLLLVFLADNFEAEDIAELLRERI